MARESFVSNIDQENILQGEPILDEVSVESIDSLEFQDESSPKKVRFASNKNISSKTVDQPKKEKKSKKFEIRRFLNTGITDHEKEEIKK